MEEGLTQMEDEEEFDVVSHYPDIVDVSAPVGVLALHVRVWVWVCVRLCWGCALLVCACVCVVGVRCW